MGFSTDTDSDTATAMATPRTTEDTDTDTHPTTEATDTMERERPASSRRRPTEHQPTTLISVHIPSSLSINKDFYASYCILELPDKCRKID